MEWLYILTAVVGGVLILLSAIGHGDGDASHDLDHGFEAGGDHEVGHDFGHGTDHDHGGGLWLPFFSLRFWTYLMAGFGLTGLLFTYLNLAPAAVVPIFAGGVGIVAGLSVSLAMRYLRRSEASSGINAGDVRGHEAEVLVPVRPGAPGKVRLIVKGDTIDFLATTDGPAELGVGSVAIVLDMEGDHLKVIGRNALFDEDALVLPRA